MRSNWFSSSSLLGFLTLETKNNDKIQQKKKNEEIIHMGQVWFDLPTQGGLLVP